jgi:hypothetical protein
MKRKFIVTIMVIVVMVLGAFSAQAERKIQPYKSSSPAYIVPATDNTVAINKLSKKVKGLQTSLVGKNGAIKKLRDDVEQNSTDIKAVAENAGRIATATEEVGGKVGAIDTTMRQESKNSGQQIVRNFWLFGVIIVLGFICIAALIIYFSKRSEKCLNQKTVTILKGMKEIVNEFDASPIAIKIAGREVGLYYLSEDEKEGKFYFTLQVEDEADGKPENFVRQMEPKRGVAAKYISGVVKKFRDGDLAGTPQEKLIGYLKGKGILMLSF